MTFVPRRFFASLVALMLFCALLSAPLPAQAQAGTYNASTPAELIAAINAANADGLASTINLSSGAIFAFSSGTGGTALPTITGSMTIEGNSAILRRASTAGDLRLISVSGGTLVLNNITIEDGRASFNGGNIFITGALADVTISNSVIQRGLSGNLGGGIYKAAGLLRISSSRILNNTATSIGGGIFNVSSSLTIADSSLRDNRTTSSAGIGGAILNSDGASLTVQRSSFVGNSSATGAGIANQFNASTTLVNSTFSGNTGVGLWADSGQVNVFNSSFVNNGTGISRLNSATVTLTNSLLGGNSSANCNGAVSSGGNNLSSDNSCGLSGSGDQSNLNPQVAPLANNGGLTQTHALLFNSPAVDAGNSSVCSGEPVQGIDQRGASRSQGTACDIGAFESAFVPEVSLSKSPDEQVVVAGGTASFEIIVENTGDVPLRDLSVSDPLTPDCDQLIATLAIGERFTYACSAEDVQASFLNTASVSASPGNLLESDSAQVTVSEPGIALSKSADMTLATVNDLITYTYVITNTGNVSLSDVSLVDDQLGAITLPGTDLAPGALI